MFITIDNWFLDKIFQPFSDWFMDNYGHGKHWLAATFAYLYAATVIVKQLYLPSTTWFQMAVEAGIVLYMIFIAKKHDLGDKKNEDPLNAVMNSMRIDPLFRLLRIVGWPILILNISDIFRNDIETLNDIFRSFQSFLFSCFLYFEACDTKPPKPKKKTQEKLVTKPA